LINTPSNLPASQQEPPHGIPFPLADEKEGGAGFTLLQLWSMVRAHLWLSIGLFAVLVALAYVGIKNLPKSYVATADLIVNSDNTDPLAGRNYPVGQQGSFFPTQVELINNSVTLLPVIDRLKLQENEHFTGGYVGDPKTLNDIVLANLRSSLDVAPGRGSQLLYVSATAGNPGLAADIANAVADEYLRQNSQRTNAPAVQQAERYADQLAELKSKYDAAQAKLDDYRQRNDMAELKEGQNGDAEGAGLYDLQAQLQAASKERRLLDSKQIDPRATSSAVLDMPEVINLQSDLDKFEADLAKARAAKLGPNHPTITKLQGQITATREQINAAVRARSDNLALQLKRATELENKLQAEYKRERERVLNRRTVGDEGSRLLLEMQNTKDAYSQALKGQDQVQFKSMGNYQDIQLVHRADPPVKASKPNKMKLFAMAFLASLSLALGGPFAYELLLDRRIRCRDDLEKGFGIVTLAQLGRLTPAPAT
jgi:uncharacterized protein involved in exopolysaccharide biosynthesis